jgi:hypothetical protein
MLGFNGGLMGVRRTPTNEVATGLWFQNEQSVAKRAEIWPATPQPGSARYWRLANFADTSLDFNTIDFGEIELYEADTKHTGITCTSNISFQNGTAAVIVDGITDTNTRVYNSSWSGIRSTATITLDLGSTKTVTHIKIFSLYTQPRFPASFDLQSSADDVTYTTFDTVTVGTLSLVSGVTYSSAKVAVG